MTGPRRHGHKPETIRSHNLGLMLQTICRDRRVRRGDLVEQSGLTKTTVSDLLSDLTAQGLIAEEVDHEATGVGRKPSLIGPVPDAAVFVGLSIRRAMVSAVLLNLVGHIVSQHTVVVLGSDSQDDVLSKAHTSIDRVLAAKPAGSNVVGIGVGLPGPLDLRRRTATGLGLGIESQETVVQSLQRRYQLPVEVEFGAVAAAYGEYHERVRRGDEPHDLGFLEIDLGIGFGYVVDGTIAHGQKQGGFVGHNVVQSNGRTCGCGRHGCLYQYSSGMAIIRELERHIQHDESIEPENLDKEIAELQRKLGCRDEKLSHIIAAAADYLCVTLADLFNLLNPSVLVIGSCFPNLADEYLPQVVRRIGNHHPLVDGVADRVQLSRYNASAIAAGGANLVMGAFMSDPLGYVAESQQGSRRRHPIAGGILPSTLVSVI